MSHPRSPCHSEAKPRNRIRASLIASAVGDALGEPTEFLKRHEIDALVDARGVRTFLDPTCGHITDDTQMLLFTAEAMVLARAHYHKSNSLDAVLPCAFQAYVRWLQTQGYRRADGGRVDGWMHEADAAPSLLLADPLMHQYRAPGNICITALRDAPSPGTRTNMINTSKGCGTVMRIAPVGMVFRDLDDSTVTHTHPTGYLAGGAMALIVKVLVNGGTLDDAINAVMIQLYDQPEHHARAKMHAIVTGYKTGTTQPLTISMLDALGGGWVAEEALSMAIAATAACNGNTMDALATCAAINGDSDSVASMAGTLCGALYGASDNSAILFTQIKEHTAIDQLLSSLLDSSGLAT